MDEFDYSHEWTCFAKIHNVGNTWIDPNKYSTTTHYCVMFEFRKTLHEGKLTQLIWLTSNYLITIEAIQFHTRFNIAGAIRLGCLDVIMWFNTKYDAIERSEDPIANKINLAICYGHHHVARYLIQLAPADTSLDFEIYWSQVYEPAGLVWLFSSSFKPSKQNAITLFHRVATCRKGIPALCVIIDAYQLTLQDLDPGNMFDESITTYDYETFIWFMKRFDVKLDLDVITSRYNLAKRRRSGYRYNYIRVLNAMNT